jgi:hypothetical protein
MTVDMTSIGGSGRRRDARGERVTVPLDVYDAHASRGAEPTIVASAMEAE